MTADTLWFNPSPPSQQALVKSYKVQHVLFDEHHHRRVGFGHGGRGRAVPGPADGRAGRAGHPDRPAGMGTIGANAAPVRLLSNTTPCADDAWSRIPGSTGEPLVRNGLDRRRGRDGVGQSVAGSLRPTSVPVRQRLHDGGGADADQYIYSHTTASVGPPTAPLHWLAGATAWASRAVRVGRCVTYASRRGSTGQRRRRPGPVVDALPGAGRPASIQVRDHHYIAVSAYAWGPEMALFSGFFSGQLEQQTARCDPARHGAGAPGAGARALRHSAASRTVTLPPSEVTGTGYARVPVKQLRGGGQRHDQQRGALDLPAPTGDWTGPIKSLLLIDTVANRVIAMADPVAGNRARRRGCPVVRRRSHPISRV